MGCCDKGIQFIYDMKKVLRHAATKGEVLSKEKYAARMEVCNKCEHRRPYSRFLMCEKCGCLLNLKAQLIASECPIGRW